MLSRVQLFTTPWTLAHQAPLSMGFSRQEYWSGLLSNSPGDLPNPGTEPRSPTLQADSLPSEPPGKPSAAAAAAKSLQSCPTLCDPIDGRPPGAPYCMHICNKCDTLFFKLNPLYDTLFFIFCYSLCFKVSFVSYWYCYPAFLSFLVA